MAREHKARDQGLQCDRIDRNQLRGFSDQPRHGGPSYRRLLQRVQLRLMAATSEWSRPRPGLQPPHPPLSSSHIVAKEALQTEVDVLSLKGFPRSAHNARCYRSLPKLFASKRRSCLPRSTRFAFSRRRPPSPSPPIPTLRIA